MTQGRATQGTSEHEGRPLLNRRLAAFGTTIFAEMSALALRTGSINLGQGFPDTDGPEEIREAAVRALRDGRGNQYPPGPGVPELRAAVAAHQERFYGLSWSPETEILVTTGATEAIAASLLALLEPGDEVIAFEPYYDSYAACIAMAGARRVPLTLRAPGFRPDLDELRSLITPRTRLLLLNTPHNPTGTVLTPDELSGIAALAVEHDLLVVTDEVYEHLVFAGAHHPIAALPGMRGRTVSISSAEDVLVHGVEGRLGHRGRGAGGGGALGEAIPDLRERRPVPVRDRRGSGPPGHLLHRLPRGYAPQAGPAGHGAAGRRFQVYEPEGTYFITTDIAPFGDEDAYAFCRALPERCGVAAVPNSVFYDDPEAGRSQVRFTFCKRDEVLEEAVTRLGRLTG